MTSDPQFTGNPRSAEPEAFDLAEYWRIIRKRQRLILTAVVVAIVVAAVASLMTPSSYRGTVLINVEKERPSAFDIGAAQAAVGYDPEFLPTQTRLMQSREVAERVVRRLNLVEHPEFRARDTGFIKSLLPGADEPEAAGEGAVAAVAKSIQESTQTRPIRGTNLVELSVVAATPQLSAEIANALAEAYIDWKLESKFLVVGQASRFLGTQIEQLKTEIDEKERALQAYGAETDIISVDPSANITMQKLESLNRDYAAAVGDRVSREARYYELQNARPESIADTLSSGLVSSLRTDLAKLEREYAEKLNLFKPEWPAMQQLKAQIDEGRENLTRVVNETVAKARDNARTEYLAARRREDSLAGVMQGQKREAMTLNSNAVEYNNLRTEVETRRTLLDTLMARQAETEVTSRLSGERVSSVRVVDTALPPEGRFRPSYKRNGMLGLFFGAAFGLGLAFLLEFLDRSVRSTDQVEHQLQLPPLGIIPAISSAGARAYGYYGLRRSHSKKVKKDEESDVELIPHTQPRATISEAYRAFRTALLLSRAGGVKTIAITSSAPGEGKSSTAVNLAVVLGQLGKNVLIVDGDLHKARIHEVFKISNRAGLVTLLAQGGNPEQIITATKVPHVSVLPAGPTSPNPSGLLSSDAMKKLLEWAHDQYDYVIIDTPPVGPVADAFILGSLADGVVLTVRGGETSREIVASTRDKLRRANVRILGVLINALPESEGAYGYDYSYYGKTAYGDKST